MALGIKRVIRSAKFVRNLFDILTESHQFSTSDGVIFADYEEVDDVTPENYARLIRELNLRDFGRASP